MGRAGEQRTGRRLLHDPAGVHHADPVAQGRHHPQVVGHEHDGRTQPVPDLPEQREDLGLDGHVERGRRFVGQQHPWLAGQRHRDHDPLAHAARELVGIAVQPVRCVGHVHLLEELRRPGARLGPAHAPVHLQDLAHLAADREVGVQGAHGVLEDHRDLRTPGLPEPGGRHGQQVPAGERRRAPHLDTRRQQSHQGQ